MSAKVKFDKMWSNIIVGFYENDVRTMVSLTLNSLTPEQKAQLREMNPQAFDKVQEAFLK